MSSAKAARGVPRTSPGDPFVSPCQWRPHILPVTCAVMHPDGTKVATASDDKTVKVYGVQASGGVPELFELTGHTNSIHKVLWDPFHLAADGHSGDRILTASFDKTSRVYEISPRPSKSNHGGTLVHTLTGASGEVVEIEISSALYILAEMGHLVLCFDRKSGALIHRLPQHTAEVVSLALSRAGKYLATASFDHTCCVFDLQSGGLVNRLYGHRGELSSVAFCPGEADDDSSSKLTLMTGSIDRTLRQWQVDLSRQSVECVGTLRGHTDEVLDVRFSRDGRLVFSGSADGTVRVHNAQTRDCFQHFIGHSGEVVALATTYDGIVLTSSSDKTVKAWDPWTAKVLQTWTYHTDEIVKITADARGERFAVCSKDNHVSILHRRSTVTTAVIAGVMALTAAADPSSVPLPPFVDIVQMLVGPSEA